MRLCLIVEMNGVGGLGLKGDIETGKKEREGKKKGENMLSIESWWNRVKTTKAVLGLDTLDKHAEGRRRTGTSTVPK